MFLHSKEHRNSHLLVVFSIVLALTQHNDIYYIGSSGPSWEEPLRTALSLRVSSSCCTFLVSSYKASFFLAFSQSLSHVLWTKTATAPNLRFSCRPQADLHWADGEDASPHRAAQQWDGQRQGDLRSARGYSLASNVCSVFWPISRPQARVRGTGKALMDRNMPPVAGQLNFSQEMR